MGLPDYIAKHRLRETPLPDDWNSNEINNTSSFTKTIAGIVAKSKKIGTGSSRIAFEVKQPGFEHTTIKVAKNKKGLAQNELEERVLQDTDYSDILPKLIDSDSSSIMYRKNGMPLWIQVEKARTVTNEDIEKYLGISDARELKYYLESKLDRRTYEISEENRKALDNNPFTEKLIELVYEYDLDTYDITYYKNLGFIKNKLVVIDVGASEDIIQAYYKS